MTTTPTSLAHDGPAPTEGFSPHVHAHIPATDPRRYKAVAYMRICQTGWLLAAAGAAFVIAAAMLVGYFNLEGLFGATQPGGSPPDEGNTAATLLLALLGVSASVLVRPGEHPLASRMLRPVRFLLVLDTAVMLTGAGYLVVHKPGAVPNAHLVLGLAIFTVFVLFLIGMSWLLPRKKAKLP